MNKKAFTLMEILIAVIIVGILAVLSVPQLVKSLEKAKGEDAKLGLNLIYRAEIDYAAYRGGLYTTSTNDLLDVVLNKRFWDFVIVTPTTTTFTAIATRKGGGYKGKTVTMDDTGKLSGTWEFR